MSLKYQKGDTIIEVVLAFAIFSLAAVGTIALINSGLATTQRNLETTLVRQQIDSQAELLRYLRDTQNPAWQAITDSSRLVNNPAELSDSCRTIDTSTQAFYVQPSIAPNPEDTSYVRHALTSMDRPDTYAKINYSDGATVSQGLWIQATRAEQSGASSVSAYDFYIHACWDSVGTDEPMTLGTIVRIYD